MVKPTSESLVKLLYDSLSAEQRKQVCFAWGHVAENLGLLQTRISANWHVTKPVIESDFYTADQQKLIREIFLGLIQPDWVARIDKHLKDDEGGFGRQSVAIFGTPGSDKFEFVLTGRHITLRCDGNSAEHVAFGGPIVYGHAASGFNEKPGHPDNVFWPQAVAANSVFKILDGKQQATARSRPRHGRMPSRSRAARARSRAFPSASFRPTRRPTYRPCWRYLSSLTASRIATAWLPA